MLQNIFYNKVVGCDSSYLVQMVRFVKHYIYIVFLGCYSLKRRLNVKNKKLKISLESTVGTST